MVRVPKRKSDGTGIFFALFKAPALFTRTRRHREQRCRASRPATTPASSTCCSGRAPPLAVRCRRAGAEEDGEREVSLRVVPAKAGTHTPRPRSGHDGRRLLLQQGAVVMGPCFRRDDALSSVGPRPDSYSFTFQTALDPEHGFAVSPPVRREVCRQRPPSEIRGRREDRVRAAPAVSCAKWADKNAHEHTGSAEAIRPSLRNGFTAYTRSPR